MKQFTFEYLNQAQLATNLDRVATWASKNGLNQIWIQVYVMDETGDCFQIIADAIDLCIPDAKYMMTHAGMAFVSGSKSDVLAMIVCNVFEEPDSRVELRQYEFTPDCYDQTVDAMIDYVNKNPWIRLMSINTGSNLGGISCMNKLTESIDPNIVISGGAAITLSLATPAKVLSSDGHISTTALIVAYIGGDNFEARTDVVVGWKGIGKEFTITKGEGALINEIDGKPAFDVYRKYFKIDAEPGMIVPQTIEFPLCFEDKGILFLRCPLLLNPDGSMIMMLNDLSVGTKVRLSFGSMDVILDELATKLDEIAEFEPQVITVNSCIGRLFFWGDKITSEIGLFKKIAPSSGFLTGGELMRRGNRMLVMNETIVNTAMREGKKSIDGSGVRKIGRVVKDYSLAHRLATFIDTVTSDLEEYNKTIDRMAKIDELTDLYNRRETANIISRLIADKKSFSLVMIDADNFKKINDTYGHKEGDRVLQLLSDIIKVVIKDGNIDAYAGRWGGDEFMIVCAGDIDIAKGLAEDIQIKYNSKTAYKEFPRTLSIGIAHIDEAGDEGDIFQIVDEKLYAAKANGKANIVS